MTGLSALLECQATLQEMVSSGAQQLEDVATALSNDALTAPARRAW